MNKKTESIRKEIKAMGYNSRTVSVRSDSNSINVVLKKLIAIKPIKKICNKYKSIERCERTGEILSGGNTFVFVEYDYDMLKNEEEMRHEIAKKIIEKTTSSKYYENIALNEKIIVKFNGEEAFVRLQNNENNSVQLIEDRYRIDCFQQLARALAIIEAEYGKLIIQ